MKKKQKYLLIFTTLALVVATGLLLRGNNIASTADTAETQQINKFIAQASIDRIKGWAIYPNCGNAGGRNDGYLLQVNNLEVSPGQASELRSLATSRDYVIKERADGYVIENNNWDIIVLNKNRADLFITIHYSEKPNGFPEGGRLCS